MGLQAKLKKIKEVAANERFTDGVAGVSVTVTGAKNVLRIEIDPSLKSLELDELADVITESVNRASAKADQAIESMTKEALGPLGKFMPT